MKRCIIITAFNPEGFPLLAVPQPEDILLCADSGFLTAKEQGLRPDFIIGDFDSPDAVRRPPENQPDLDGVPILRVPCEKDDTDTMLCVRQGLSLGFRHFLIVGGIGGRLDHTLANIQTLAYLKTCGADGMLITPSTQVFLADPGIFSLHKDCGSRFSLFAFSERCTGITLRGAKYPLCEAVLENSFPLGVSNAFSEDQVTVSFTGGRLLVVTSFGD